MCFPLARLYKELGELNAKSVIVFMDACFSGAQRGNGMLASARGVAIKAKEQKPMGKLVVLTAASGEETDHALHLRIYDALLQPDPLLPDRVQQ